MEKIQIFKPVYGTFVYLREATLQKAIRNNEPVEVTIPQGVAIIDPKKWIETGKRLEKVFKIPNQPMLLIGNSVPLEDIKPPHH